MLLYNLRRPTILRMEHVEDGKVYKGKNFDRWRKDNVDLIESILTQQKMSEFK